VQPFDRIPRTEGSKHRFPRTGRILMKSVRLPLSSTVVFGALLFAGGCGDDSGGDQAGISACDTEVESRNCATQLAAADSMLSWTEGAPRPVVVYFDLSGSMRGFLDPAYPTGPTNYSSVIDGLIAGLRAETAFGYGSTLRPAPASLGTLGNRDFYSDSNTEMEAAIDRIATDTTRASSHLLVGDGRRGDPDAANEQFTAMRTQAQRWIEGGGTFVVAASLAPFTPVENDPAGCRDGRGAGGERRTCPLYAFGFLAAGDESRITATLTSVFEHVFVWPVPSPQPGQLVLRPSAAATTGITVHPQWIVTPDGTPVARSNATAYVNQPLEVEVVSSDESSARGRLERAILDGQELGVNVWARPLSLPAQFWISMPAQGSLLRTNPSDPFRLELLSHGADAPRFVYRIDYHPTGTPSWLGQFDAESASDELRTFGLGRLFTAFQQQAGTGSPPAGRVFIVLN
jgi:hypothetical protein